MLKKAALPYISQNRKKNSVSSLYFLLPCILLPLLTFPAAGWPNPVKEDTNFSVSANYTTINEYGEETLCTISSNDTINKLNELKNRDCKLPIPGEGNHQSVTLVAQSPYETRQMLLTTRNLLMWAHMAVHLYKVWDAGSKILWPPVCPCSGKPKVVTHTQRFFFTYYLTSLLHNGWSYLSPYFWPENTPEHSHGVENHHDTAAPATTEGWTETLAAIIATAYTTVTEQPYASHILSLALDTAALAWDCQCAGYFSDAAGNFYFNGHLWMLLLNVAIFTIDLAIDYL